MLYRGLRSQNALSQASMPATVGDRRRLYRHFVGPDRQMVRKHHYLISNHQQKFHRRCPHAHVVVHSHNCSWLAALIGFRERLLLVVIVADDVPLAARRRYPR
jgi:hypothetical protein